MEENQEDVRRQRGREQKQEIERVREQRKKSRERGDGMRTGVGICRSQTTTDQPLALAVRRLPRKLPDLS
jgi:hypothetical protein